MFGRKDRLLGPEVRSGGPHQALGEAGFVATWATTRDVILTLTG